MERRPPPPRLGSLPRPALLVTAVAVVALETGLLLGVAAFSVAEVALGRADQPTTALATAALAGLIGGFLAACARGLWHGRRWARAPVVTWQLLQLAVAAPALAGSSWWVGAAFVGASVLVVAALLAPAVVRATASTGDPPVT